MSWLGGSLSSLTGQLSNLTKDILTEGTEEVSEEGTTDHVTELRLSQEKLKELDTLCVGQKIEIDRLKLLVREWEEKAEGSELQINSISREYRTLLEEKENEIKVLKKHQHEQQELKSSYVNQETTPAVLTLDSDGFENVGYGGDELDFGDNIAMQQDINRLRGDIQRLQTVCQHWKGLVKQQTNADGATEQETHFLNKGDDSASLKQIQDLQQQLAYEKDQRQFELSSLQDAHSHKVSTIRKKHKEEVAELKREMQEMDWGTDGWESQVPGDTESLKETISSLKEEIANLRLERDDHVQQIITLKDTIEQQKADLSVKQDMIEQQKSDLSIKQDVIEQQKSDLSTKQDVIEQQKSDLSVKQAQTLHLDNQLKVAKEEIDRLLTDHDQVGRDLYDTKQQLLDQLDANHADTLEILSDLREVRQHMDHRAIDRRNKLLTEKDKIVNELIDSGEKKKEVSEDVVKLESEHQALREEANMMVDQLGNTQHQVLTADIIDTLEKENLLLKKRNVGLQEQVTLLEKAVQNITNEKDGGAQHGAKAKQSVSADSGTLESGDDFDVLSDATSFTSDLSELSRRNMELDEQVINLRAQINKYESEIDQFEMLRSDWLNEKEALEDVLMQLRGQMKEKENSLNVVEAQKGLEKTIHKGHIGDCLLQNHQARYKRDGLIAVEKHENKKAMLPDLVDANSKPLDGIAEDIVELDSKIEQLAEANAQLEQERDALIEEKDSLQMEIDELKFANQSHSIQKTEESTIKAGASADMNKLLVEKEDELRSLMTEKEDLEKNLAEVPELKQQLQVKQDQVNNLLKAGEEIETLEKEIVELKKKLRGKNEEIVNLSLEKEEMMSSLEELDNQNQEAMGHVIQIKDQLSKSNEELKKKLSNSEAEVHGLRSEVQKLTSQNMVNQTDESSNSNELNHQIAELKENNSALEQKLQKCNTTISKLENDIKSRDEQIQGMSDKLASSAAALNDLHMDKQELEEKVLKCKGEISSQSSRLKQVREENELLRQELAGEDENDSLNEKALEGLQGKNSSAEDIERLEKHVDTLNLDMDDVKEQLKKKTAKCIQFQSDIQVLELEIEKEKANRKSNEAEITELKTVLSQKEETVEELKSELESSKKDCKKLTAESNRKHEECESFSRQLHALENQLHSLQSTTSEKDKENGILTSQVEMLNNELTLFKQNLTSKNSECDALNSEVKKAKELLHDTTDKLHTKCEDCNELMARIETLKHEITTLSEEKEYDARLLSATGELVLVKEELSNKTDEWEKLDKELYVKDGKINSLKQTRYSLEKEIEQLKTQFRELQEESDQVEKTLRQDCVNKVEELESQKGSIENENDKLKSDITTMEHKLNSQAKHYESFIEDLKSTKESSTSGLQSQFDELLEKCHKKDLHITEIETELKNVTSKLQECNENVQSLSENYEKLQDVCNTKDREVIELRDSVNKMKGENSILSESSKQDELTLIELNDAQENLEMLKKEKVSLEDEMVILKHQTEKIVEESKQEKDKLNFSLQDLETEVGNLRDQLREQQYNHHSLLTEKEELQETVQNLQLEVEKHKRTVIDYEAGMADLNQKRSENLQTIERDLERLKAQDDHIEVLKQTSVQKENEITILQRKLSHAKSFIGEDQLKMLENETQVITPNYNLPALEYKEKGQIEFVEVNETMELSKSENKLGMEVRNGESENEFSMHERDITVEIDRLRDQLNEKDNVISELQRNNASLLKMLDSKSKSSQGDSSLIEMHKLENEIRTLKIEREQMMDVLNEKSRESSSLKTENQRLLNFVTAEKAALEKLQKDNQELMKKSPENDRFHTDDMQKETVKNLSRIIRDKDLEIESLAQKNETLLSVLQETSSEGTQINSLMQDKDNLTKQLAALQGEREQMIAYLNQKHQESLAYHNEVQRLTAYINAENEKNEKMKQDYEILIPQFEDKKQSLLKAQNELINYKQKFTELEVKYGQMVQQSSTGDTVDKTLFDSKVQEANKLQERYQEMMDSVREKETRIQNLHQNISELEQNFRTIDSERNGFKKQVDNFVFQLHGLQTEQVEMKSEISQLKQQKNEFMSECQVSKEMNNRLTLQLQDKDFELQSLQEKAQSLTLMIQERQGEKGQMEHVMVENETTQKRMKQLQQERDQSAMATQHSQEQNAQLLKDIQSLKERENKLNRELDRLRQHLIQIEDGYTREALSAEEREKDLRTRLATAEERALTSSSAVESASQQASHQLDSLQQQLAFISQQRDQAYLQISSLQEQNQMYTVSMANLQMVLEEFQQEKDRLVAEETERCEAAVKTLTAQVSRLQADLKYTKDQLDEASDGLEAAARLSEQLDRKEEAIDALREEVQIRESALKVTEEELHKLQSRSDDRVDKLVIKNLFLGYFTTPQNKRHEVLRAIGGVLLFTADDFEKIEGPNRGGWVPGFLRFGGGGSGGKPTISPPSTPIRRSTIGGPVARGVDNSFSQMFVKFLERESSPPPPTVRLPAEQMVRDVQKQKESQKPAYNPFTAPRHVALPLQTSHAPGAPPSSQHILMSSAASMSPTLQTFAAPSETSRTPPGSGRNTPATTTSGAILKDVLNR